MPKLALAKDEVFYHALKIPDSSGKKIKLWQAGMDNTEWFTHRTSIIYQFEQHGVREFFINPLPLAAGVAPQELVCKYSDVPMDIDAEVQINIGNRIMDAGETRGLLIQLLDDMVNLDPADRARELFKIDQQHINKVAEITMDEKRIFAQTERSEQIRESGRDKWDEKISNCFKVLLVCFHSQYIRHHNEMLSNKQFRRFWATIDATNSYFNTGSVTKFQASNEMNAFKFNSDFDYLEDNLLHLETLILKFTALGGTIDDEEKKFILAKAIEECGYSEKFKESVRLAAVIDETIPVVDRLSYEDFVLRIRENFTKNSVVQTMDRNTSSGKAKILRSGPGKQVNVIKHSNKAITKPQSNEKKSKDLSKVTCYACSEKGHYRGNKICPMFKTKEQQGEVSLSKEFAKSTTGK